MFFMEVPTIIIPESKKHRGKMWKVRLATCFSISLQDQRPGDITATMLKWGGYPKNHGGQNWRYKILYIIQLLYIIYIYIIHMCVSIWVNYNNSLAWNKAILDDSAFSPWFQWGRSEVVIICPDLCVYLYICIHRHILDVLGASLFLWETFWLEGFRCCIMLYLWVDDAQRISWLVVSTPLKNMKVS